MYASTTEQRSRERVRVLAEQLYRERYDHLLRIAATNAANRDDAEEAVQFAFLAFIEHFDPEGEAPPLAWLTLVATRDCWRRYRAQHLDRSVGQEAEPGGEGPGAVLDAIPSPASGPEQLIAWVDEARAKLVALKPAERRTLCLIAAGYSYAEVGQITGFSYTYANLRVMPTSVRKPALQAEIALRMSA